MAFNRHIIRGCRAVKVSTMGFDAFESVNAQYLGEVFADGLRVYDRQEGNGPLRLLDNVSTDVFLLKLIPGTNPRLFDHLREIGYRGVVLETFGAGGMHFHRRDLLEKLRMLSQQGIVTVACSQCLYEPSDLTIYEVGRKMLETGVIPAGDMTTEATVTKLMWALGQTEDPETVRKLFQTNLAGELSRPADEKMQKTPTAKAVGAIFFMRAGTARTICKRIKELDTVQFDASPPFPGRAGLSAHPGIFPRRSVPPPPF